MPLPSYALPMVDYKGGEGGGAVGGPVSAARYGTVHVQGKITVQLSVLNDLSWAISPLEAQGQSRYCVHQK